MLIKLTPFIITLFFMPLLIALGIFALGTGIQILKPETTRTYSNFFGAAFKAVGVYSSIMAILNACLYTLSNEPLICFIGILMYSAIAFACYFYNNELEETVARNNRISCENISKSPVAPITIASGAFLQRNHHPKAYRKVNHV